VKVLDAVLNCLCMSLCRLTQSDTRGVVKKAVWLCWVPPSPASYYEQANYSIELLSRWFSVLLFSGSFLWLILSSAPDHSILWDLDCSLPTFTSLFFLFLLVFFFSRAQWIIRQVSSQSPLSRLLNPSQKVTQKVKVEAPHTAASAASCSPPLELKPGLSDITS